MKKEIMKRASELEEKIIGHRRFIHKNAECGFKLNLTAKYVKDNLKNMGYEVKKYGKCSLVCSVGKGEKTVLLRADMDALPIKEETELPFRAVNGNMHACGHDMHTAMLLGAAEILKVYEHSINGRVVFLFQSAEELLEGAKDVIEAGLLKDVKPNYALMLHIIAEEDIKSGTAIVSSGGVSAPAADYFTVTVNGKSAHASLPHKGIDAISAAAHILISLQEIKSKELSAEEEAVIAICGFNGGTAYNIIADKAVIKGNLRTYDESVRNYIKERLISISKYVGEAHRTEATVKFISGCPALVNDKEVSDRVYRGLLKLSNIKVLKSDELNPYGKRTAGGSEDFAYISQKIPSVMVALSALKNGAENVALHHPKIDFDESELKTGAVVYTCGALSLL